jgi:ketosteroid isomerase-like protein
MTKEEPIASDEKKNKTKEEKPNGKLICPNCKLLYEKMTVCIRCGATLVKEIPSQPVEKPKPSYRPEVKKEKLKADDSPEVKKDPLKPAYPPKIKGEPPQVQTPEKRSTDKLIENIGKSASTPRKSKKTSLRLVLEGLSVFILIAIGIFFLWSIYSHFATGRSGPGTSALEEATSLVPQSASPPTHQTTTVAEPQEKEEKQPTRSSPMNESQEIEGIKDLLEKIRQANLQKNIDLFMSCYSADFKDREGKKRATLESWGNFNYLDLSYDLKRHLISADTAKARVEWLMRISPKIGGQPQENKTALDVTFKKEDDGWKIKETKPVS